MEKSELRNRLLKESSVAGDSAFELKQLQKAQDASEERDIHTLTVTCSEIASIICC